MAGIQYLDTLFSAIRDTAERLSTADAWMSRAERAAESTWRMSFLQAARDAQSSARSRLDEAFAQLSALGPADRLPSLLADLPERLEQLRGRLEASEARLTAVTNTVLQKPYGMA
ncbi:MAG: hypothetical protein IPM54_32065 [Polyangiaceae bacterium]|nr:hypothetical protein [Polyangiaceae bacterium]